MNDFKPLIQHFLKNNSEEVLAKSKLNCHVEKLHSIMLLDSPGQIIRIFIAEPGNKLWTNQHPYIHKKQSLAFHAHHCDLTLQCIHGEFTNRNLMEGDIESIPSYEYISAIKTGKGSFKKSGKNNFGFTRDVNLRRGDSIDLKASDIHTVTVPKDTWAAWLVFEGREDKEYDSKCYSFADLEKESFAKLYKPVDKKILKNLIAQIL